MKKTSLVAAFLAGGIAIGTAGATLAAETVKIAAQEPGGSF